MLIANLFKRGNNTPNYVTKQELEVSCNHLLNEIKSLHVKRATAENNQKPISLHDELMLLVKHLDEASKGTLYYKSYDEYIDKFKSCIFNIERIKN